MSSNTSTVVSDSPVDDRGLMEPTTDGRSAGGDGLHRLFDLAVVAKGLMGGFELIAGLLLLVLAPSQLAAPLLWLGRSELGEFHPVGLFAASAAAATTDLAPATVIFAAIYLLFHGLIKVVLVVAVLRHRLWAYPWMIAALIGFITCQTYEMIINFTMGLCALTVFDIVVVALTMREFRLQKRKRVTAG